MARGPASGKAAPMTARVACAAGLACAAGRDKAGKGASTPIGTGSAMRATLAAMVGLGLLLAAAPAQAASGVDGRLLGLVWVLPFAGLLLSIAICPLAVPDIWHHHYGKIGAVWAAAFLLPFALVHGLALAWYEAAHMILLDYLPFVVLILALYTTAGGVLLKGTLPGTPSVNTAVLAAGTLVASITGTTGASMLFIRPLLRANAGRVHKTHTFVFFIFLVSNIGGSLTPLGDPPLFLGFLRGVDFFWPTKHMALPMAIASAILLAIYYVLEVRAFRRESFPDEDAPAVIEKPGVAGWINVALLAAILVVVLILGVWRPGRFTILGQSMAIQVGLATLALPAITLLSLWLTPTTLREANGFTWAAMKEVAKLFAAIFITIIPALAILKAGQEGALHWLLALTSRPDGLPDPLVYFWVTGVLSSFLDNAPTYLIFFNLAGGDPVALMGPMAQVLLAISAGAVFMGANSYIGNAPNFLVRSIAEENGVPMPSFFAYCGWAVLFLFPIFVLITFLFFR
jgi:Na+/H+ antiporter NhaD/arsenite permease-like protein